jgi:glutathione S-transferase
MQLLYQTHSPYARKVLVAAHELGLAGSVQVIHHETSPTRRNAEVFALNPLGKVPVLLCDDGPVLFDSSVICDYLDSLHGQPMLIPAEPKLRYRALQWQALAQGMADAGIAVRWEAERRPESLRWPTMREGQLQKVIAACDFLEREIVANAAIDIGTIAIATTLSWIEFRGVYPFRTGRPHLSSWYAAFCMRPSMRATTLSGYTND